MLETYRGIPYLLDTWLVLTGLALPVVVLTARRIGHLPTRLAMLLLPASFGLILAATLSPTAQVLGSIGSCGTSLTSKGGLTTLQGLLNVVLFVPASGLLAIAAGKPLLGLTAGVSLSAAVEAVQALIPTLGRSCQVHDLIANTLGAVAGVSLVGVVGLLSRLRPVGAAAPLRVEHAAMIVTRPGGVRRASDARRRRTPSGPAMAVARVRRADARATTTRPA